MKNTLLFGAALGIALLTAVGCGDDATSPTDINTHFELKQGDTFTYARYDRDMQNQRVESTKTMHKWVVVQTGLTYQGKTGVAKMLQLNFDATGTSQTGPADTVYIRSAVDGEVFMNVISATLSRIPIAAPFADTIQFKWFKVSDTKQSNASTWFSLGTQTGFIQDVEYPLPGLGNVPVRLNINAFAYHHGKVPTTIGTTSHPNAFHTDHTVTLTATGLGSTFIQDSLHLSYEVDVTSGILRQTMTSDSVTATLPGSGPVSEAVLGFEMELVSAVRAK